MGFSRIHNVTKGGWLFHFNNKEINQSERIALNFFQVLGNELVDPIHFWNFIWFSKNLIKWNLTQSYEGYSVKIFQLYAHWVPSVETNTSIKIVDFLITEKQNFYDSTNQNPCKLILKVIHVPFHQTGFTALSSDS